MIIALCFAQPSHRDAGVNVHLKELQSVCLGIPMQLQCKAVERRSGGMKKRKGKKDVKTDYLSRNPVLCHKCNVQKERNKSQNRGKARKVIIQPISAQPPSCSVTQQHRGARSLLQTPCIQCSENTFYAPTSFVASVRPRSICSTPIFVSARSIFAAAIRASR